MPTRNANLKLNPSDFTYLKRCRLCLWRKLQGRRPAQWHRRQGWNDRVADVRGQLEGGSIQSVDPSLPAGRWTRVTNDVISERFVIDHPSQRIKAYIHGRPSFNVLVAEFSDGAFGLYKIKLDNAEIRAPERHVAELHAYARAFETDSRANVQRRPIVRLGLIYVAGGLSVVELTRDERRFVGELIDMAGVWLLEQPPRAALGCPGPH